MNVGYFSDEKGKLSETIIKEKMPEAVLAKSLKEEKNKYFVMRENEIQTYHRIKWTKNYVIKEGKTKILCIGYLVEGVSSKKCKVVNAKNKEKLVVEISQRRGQLLKIVRDKECSDIILLKCEEEIRVLEELIKEPKTEEEVTSKEEEMLIISKEVEMSFNCRSRSMFVSITKDYEIEVVIKEMKDILSLEGEYGIQGQQGNVAKILGFKDTENGKEWNCSQQLERNVGKGREDLKQCRMEGVYDNTNSIIRR